MKPVKLINKGKLSKISHAKICVGEPSDNASSKRVQNKNDYKGYTKPKVDRATRFSFK